MKIVGVICKSFPGGTTSDGDTFLPSYNLEKDIFNYVVDNNTQVIGIVVNSQSHASKRLLDMVDGFIFQGGRYDLEDYHKEILQYAYDNKKPVLGICLGIQFIAEFSLDKSAIASTSEITKVNHKIDRDKRHNINISKNSMLYKLYGNNLMVTSRHYDYVKSVGDLFSITAVSDEGVTEVIEAKDKSRFFMGLQFHPESMEKSENMKLIMDEFKKFL